MSAPGASGPAGGAAGPSTASGNSPLGPEELAALFSDPIAGLNEDQAGALLGKLLGADEPRVAGVKRLLQDDDACGETLRALQALSLVSSDDRWGEAAAGSIFSWERMATVPGIDLPEESTESSARWRRRLSRSATCRLMVASLTLASGMVVSSSVSRSSSASAGGSAPSAVDIWANGARHFACHFGARHPLTTNL